jgi:HK97 family phage portal protein
MVGFPIDGGLAPYGVTAATSLGLSSVWRSVDILSNGVSQLPWQERRGNADLPPSRLVRRPLSWMTRREWTSLVVSTMALYDVTALLKVGGEDAEGVPLGLLPLDPSQWMPVDADVYGFAPPTEYYVGQERVPADQLVLVRRSPQPTISDQLGGVLRIARIEFAAALSASAYASRYWQAGGAPTTVLQTPTNMSQDDADAWSDRWAGRRAKGPDHPAVLAGGLEAKSYGADPTTESAVEARREMVADIGRYFGIPTRILNAPTGDTETYATSESANRDLVRYTLRNYIGAIEDAISDLLPGARELHLDTAELIRGDELTQAQALQIAGGGAAWMAEDELRDRWGLPPRELPEPLPAPAPAPAGGS